MGLAVQMLGWEEEFCAMLAERGFRVVRFDNRDIGHSTMLKEAGMPSRYDMFSGRRASAAYMLSDMAADTFGLMDFLGMDSAHVVGVSMGGMIGQTMAIERPERVRSLVSMMSTTGNRRVGQPSLKAWGVLLSKYPRSREDYVARVRRTLKVLGSPGLPDGRGARRRAGGGDVRPRPQHGRDHPPDPRDQRLRRPHRALRDVQVPTTVLHGSRDPLARPAAGSATAKAIPGARLRIFEGMGHDLPRTSSGPTSSRRSRQTPSAAGLRSPRRREPSEHRCPWDVGSAALTGGDAAERSRTSTEFPPRRPERRASTSSATAAGAGNLPIGDRATACHVKTIHARRSLESRRPAAIV